VPFVSGSYLAEDQGVGSQNGLYVSSGNSRYGQYGTFSTLLWRSWGEFKLPSPKFTYSMSTKRAKSVFAKKEALKKRIVSPDWHLINAFAFIAVLSVKLIGLVVENPLQESSSQDSCGTDQMAVKTVVMTNAELLIAQSCLIWDSWPTGRLCSADSIYIVLILVAS